MQSYNPAPSTGMKIGKFIVMTSLLTAGSIGVAVLFYTPPGKNTGSSDRNAGAFSAPQVPWVAAAPGRVEPRSGQIRISAAIGGRITELPVRVNDRVVEGEVLIRLDDAEARARLAAAEAEASSRRKERDAQPATAGREDVRRAEDALFTAERGITNARFELDDILAAERKGRGNAQLRADAQRRLTDAREKLRQAKLSFASAQAKGSAPAPSRLEAALAASRSEVAIAESLVDKARIRAPMAGTVLQLNVKMGETVGPGADVPLVVTGDMSVIRVRAEVDERDVAKIKLGQKAFVRSSGYPGQEFEGKVTELAPSLAPPRFGSRGPRRATDVEVMEVMIDLEGPVPLLPGMRAEAFFRREGFYRQ